MLTVRTLDGEDMERSDRVYATIFGVSLLIAVIGAFLVAWALHSGGAPADGQGKSPAAQTQQQNTAVSPR